MSRDAARRVETSTRLIGNATSLGGVRTKLESRHRWEGDRIAEEFLREHDVQVGVFLILAGKSLMDGMGNGTIFSTTPMWHEGVHLNLVITGATIVAFSFIGFDAITMYTEEAKDSSTVPKAILLALLHRERSGTGTKVSSSLLANGAWANAYMLQGVFAAMWYAASSQNSAAIYLLRL